MALNLARERAIAISAVLKACHLSSTVYQKLVKQETVTKDDKSPVTVADYTAQALISALLSHHFPSYPLIGEESSSDLFNKVEKKPLRDKIMDLANWALTERKLEVEEDEKVWEPLAKHGKREEEFWLEALDRGGHESAAKGRVWALDPIDGTKGFLRGGQYAVCLALIQDGEVVLGVMGTPNLPVDYNKPDGEKGVVFVGTKGEGSFQRSFTSSTLTPIKMSSLAPTLPLSKATFCESVESGHTSQPLNARIASLLGITKDPVRMDSQAKYCSIARGDGDIYLRLPVQKGYEEKIWDHASGVVLVEEAGGIVSDMEGKPLDFSVGRTLKNNKGVVAANKEVHGKVLEAVQKALEEKEAGKL